MRRQNGQGLVILMDGQVHTVVDVSVNGVSFQGRGLTVGQTISVRLARLVDLNDAVEAKVTVKGLTGSVVHGEFHGTLSLMRYVVAKIGPDAALPAVALEVR
ncbi:MAG TPA: PilZ domain-containing protein [Rhodospirillaceae bacterium]|nr:PilZ domain-containing protein [Rhodospirillaceae bacterium]